MDNNGNSKGAYAHSDEDYFKKDMDWFSFENKIRNLVVKLLEPVHKK